MNPWEKKSRTLSRALIVSGGLNIAFLSTFIAFAMKPTQLSKIAFNVDSTDTASSTQVFSHYFQATFQQLTGELNRAEPIEQGFKRRDLALACLVAFHDFDIKRALPGDHLQERQLKFTSPQGEELILTLYPSLGDRHFETLLAFVTTEPWPLTPEGLFYELKSGNLSESLAETFYLTPRFYALTNLFNRSQYRIEKSILLQMVLEGEWETLPKTFTHYDSATRRALLVSYLKKGSDYAARLLVETERDYVENQLDNGAMDKLIAHLSSPGEEVLSFLKTVMLGLRPDSIREKAAKKLCVLTHQSIPEPYEHSIVVKLFFPDAPTEKKVHFIKKGDTLWDLARHYGTTVPILRDVNDLSNDNIRPGKTLIIP